MTCPNCGGSSDARNAVCANGGAMLGAATGTASASRGTRRLAWVLGAAFASVRPPSARP